MKIKRLELTNYKCFEHLVLDNLGNRVVLVGPNGCGKSTVLESIAVLKEYTSTYDPNPDVYFRNVPTVGGARAWSQEVPLPIRADASAATVEAVIELNAAEQRMAGGLVETTLRVVVDRSGKVNPSGASPTVALVLRHFDPASGIGVIDYIGPNRAFPLQKIVNVSMEALSPEKQRKERIELFDHRSNGQKFSAIKQYIITEQFNDFSSNSNLSGSDYKPHDSISLLKEIFSYFFGPKTLLGTIQRGGEFQVVVRTPYGDHDIDQLSSGEKELFLTYVNLFRIRHLPSVILYDEPERHLNPGLESKLIPALDRLQTKNQLWISTHGTELIDSVPMQEIIALKREAGSSQPERFTDPSKTDRVRLFEAVGVKVGLQLASNRVVFLEGERSSTDKQLLDRLAGPRLPGVLFVASGGASQVIGSGTRAGLLIEEASKDAAFLMVIDRDYRSDTSVSHLKRRLNNRVFIWPCHEIENLLLSPQILLEVLRYNGKNDLTTASEVDTALLSAGKSLRDGFVREWVIYSLDVAADSPATGSPRDEENFKKLIRAKKERLENAYSEASIEASLADARTQVDACFQDGTWKVLLPGKEILEAFRKLYIPSLPGDMFKEQIVSRMIEINKVPGEVTELCQFILAA